MYIMYFSIVIFKDVAKFPQTKTFKDRRQHNRDGASDTGARHRARQQKLPPVAGESGVRRHRQLVRCHAAGSHQAAGVRRRHGDDRGNNRNEPASGEAQV